jgi:hypothetical protein
MILDGATNFSGLISGALSLVFEGDASLSGLEDTTGDATLGGSDTVANAGTYDFGRQHKYRHIRDVRGRPNPRLSRDP